MRRLTALPHGGAQTSAQTPASAASNNAELPLLKLDGQQPNASTTPIAACPDPLLAPVVMAATFPDDVIAAAAWSKGFSRLPSGKAWQCKRPPGRSPSSRPVAIAEQPDKNSNHRSDLRYLPRSKR
jgi:hypothetical protein